MIQFLRYYRLLFITIVDKNFMKKNFSYVYCFLNIIKGFSLIIITITICYSCNKIKCTRNTVYCVCPKCILVSPVDTEVIDRHVFLLAWLIGDLSIMRNQQPFFSREGFRFIFSSTSRIIDAH